MGMYTELCLNVELRSDVPAEVMAVLEYMVEVADHVPPTPPHDLFECPRWRYMLQCCSFYHIPRSTFILHREQGSVYLTGRSDLKDYSDEIHKFVSWLAPYIDAEEGQFLGYSRYENSLKPVLFFKEDVSCG